MRVLVCGGRDFNDANALRERLELLDSNRPFSLVIHGGARGADRLAGLWAQTRCIKVKEFPADWTGDGRAAGPIRNQRMIDEGKPDVVVAFPGGRGTADMVARARKANIQVIEIDAPSRANGSSIKDG